MKRYSLAMAVAAGCLMSGAVQAQGAIESELNASMRLGLQLDTEPDAELSFNNYGSRIRWNGSASMDDGLQGIGYIELGFDQDAGVNTTRQAWLGVEGDFGTLKGGKQYRAFYDAVTSAVDIAYWSSCYFEISCSRQSSVIKYTGQADGDIQYMASTTLVANDADNDFIDGLDIGAKLALNDISLGVGASLLIGNDVPEQDTGIGFGVSATMPMGDATVSGTLQYVNEDFIAAQSQALGADNGIIVTGTYAKDNIYGIFSIADADNTPFVLTAGYQLPIINDQAFVYFEGVVQEPDVEGEDTNLLGRAVMVFEFDVLRTGG